MQVSLKTIAKIAGVTEATVSMALRNTGTVSTKRREQILEIARKLNYTPNFNARGLSTGRSQLIGLASATSFTEVTSQLISAFDREIRPRQLQLLGSFHQGNFELEEQILRDMIGRKVDGVVGFPVTGTESRNWRLLHEAKIPFVIFNETAPYDHNEVSVDFEHGAGLMVDHLVEQGRRNLAFICTGEHSAPVQARLRGWKQACARHRIDFSACPRFFTEEIATPEIQLQLASGLASSKATIDGVCAGNDLMAVAVLRLLRHHGKEVPKDVSVVGFDDTLVSALLPLALTTVRQPIEKLAKKASTVLMNEMANPSGIHQRIVLQPELVVRETSLVR